MGTNRTLASLFTLKWAGLLLALLFVAALLLSGCGVLQSLEGRVRAKPEAPPTTEAVPGLTPYIAPPSVTLPSTASKAALLGADLYDRQCSRCHGMPPRDALAGKDEAGMTSAIVNGIGQMPGFGPKAGGSLSQAQVLSLVDFLKHAPVRVPPGPSYPHPVPMAACSSCHSPGNLGAPPATVHANMADQACPACHFPVLKQPDPVPHSASAGFACGSCHGAEGAAPLPSDHVKRTQAFCGFCHAGNKAAPLPPHTTTGTWSTCSKCHNPGTAVRTPASHTARWQDCSNEACHLVSYR